jgi:hypothetical protein
MLQRLKTLMLQSMRPGLARSVIQLMGKQDLIHFIYLAVIVLAAWGGYVMGISHAC